MDPMVWLPFGEDPVAVGQHDDGDRRAGYEPRSLASSLRRAAGYLRSLSLRWRSKTQVVLQVPRQFRRDIDDFAG